MAWIVPIAMALMSYFGSKKAGGLQQAQQQNLDQQNQEILYQRQRRQQADPALNALLHLSMGMLPTYQQAQPGIGNWAGFGVNGGGTGGGLIGTAPNGNLFQTGANGLPLGTAQTGPGNTVHMGGYQPEGPPTNRRYY